MERKKRSMTDDQSVSRLKKLYQWALALILALMAMAATRLFFTYLNYLSSQKTNFFEGGIGYVLTHTMWGNYLSLAITEGISWSIFMAVFVEKSPGKSNSTIKNTYLVLSIFFILAIVWSTLDFNYYDAFGVFGGLIGISYIRFAAR